MSFARSAEERSVAVGIGALLLGQAATARSLLAACLVISATIGTTLFERGG